MPQGPHGAVVWGRGLRLLRPPPDESPVQTLLIPSVGTPWPQCRFPVPNWSRCHQMPPRPPSPMVHPCGCHELGSRAGGAGRGGAGRGVQAGAPRHTHRGRDEGTRTYQGSRRARGCGCAQAQRDPPGPPPAQALPSHCPKPHGAGGTAPKPCGCHCQPRGTPIPWPSGIPPPQGDTWLCWGQAHMWGRAELHRGGSAWTPAWERGFAFAVPCTACPVATS